MDTLDKLDTLDKVDTLDNMDTLDKMESLEKVDSLDTFDKVDSLDTSDKVESLSIEIELLHSNLTTTQEQGDKGKVNKDHHRVRHAKCTWSSFNWSKQDFFKCQPVSKFRHLELF